MAEPFKHRLDAALVRTLGDHLRRAWRRFPRDRFEREALAGLDALALKARVDHLAGVLATVLPPSFAAAAEVLERSLRPARADTDLGALQPGPDGLAGWAIWPLTEFVARHGLAAPERALRCLHALTQRFTAEFALRPFVLAHPDLVFATLRRWVDDPSAHVRRLCSEGTRPRLPWGMRLAPLVADPSPALPLLERLQDDASDYVRRSVANHLNDIAKDHPELVADWLDRHLPAAPPPRRALLRHASRTLVKRGHPRVLAAWGVDRPLRGTATLVVAPRRAAIGAAVQLTATLQSSARRPQRLAVDYVVHHVKAGGEAKPRVWKGWTLELGPGERRELHKRHSLRPVTTRRDHPGRHAVDLVVNGRVVARSAFDLRGPKGPVGGARAVD
ncbi:MAG: DNA alkylation repair protein [Planctomycetes bacterium]|nr:DNA alkylation repair protein [Planctomycetota bacterium]